MGILVPAVTFALLSSSLPQREPGESPHPVEGVIEIALGALFLWLALRQWQVRPRDGQRPSVPQWMRNIDTITAIGAIGLGLVLVVVNPKNLLMSAKAGTEVGLLNISTPSAAIALVVFTLVAASSVLLPVLGYLASARKVEGPLQRARAWLLQENATIMCVVFLTMGVSIIGSGIQTL